jgi:hypothetical protein
VLDRSSGEGDHVSAQLKVVRPDSPPLSQARTALRHANEALAAARDEAAAAAAAYNRLAAPTTMLAGVEAQHAALKVEHDGAIVAWYEAGAVGDRPALPDELEELERRPRARTGGRTARFGPDGYLGGRDQANAHCTAREKRILNGVVDAQATAVDAAPWRHWFPDGTSLWLVIAPPGFSSAEGGGTPGGSRIAPPEFQGLRPDGI